MILNAATIGEIDAAFASLAHERADALFVAPDGFFVSRAVQFATLTARDRIPATFANPDNVAAGGLMSYGTDVADTFRQVGVYTGSILKGAKPADLPVLLAITDEVSKRSFGFRNSSPVAQIGASNLSMYVGSGVSPFLTS